MRQKEEESFLQVNGRHCFDALDIRSLLENHQHVGVENNQTGSPRVNPGRFRVAIKGTSTFPVRGIVQGVPSIGIYWLVSKGVLAIVSK